MRGIVHGIGDAVGDDPSGIGTADERGTVVGGGLDVCGTSVG